MFAIRTSISKLIPKTDKTATGSSLNERLSIDNVFIFVVTLIIINRFIFCYCMITLTWNDTHAEIFGL